MNLTGISNVELVGRLEKLAQSERKLTHVILCHINEMECRRLYAELGYDSMFRYLTARLKYSEDAAYRRLSAARLLMKSPEIAERLEDGRLTLTQLTQIQSALRQEIKKTGEDPTSLSAIVPQILEKIESKSSFETKKTLAQEFGLPIATIETVRPQRDDSVRLEITLTIEQLKTLETARDLMSHVLPDGNWAELLTLLAQKQIQKILGKENSLNLNSRPVTSNKKQDAKNTHGYPSTETTSLGAEPKQTTTKDSTRSFLVARKRGQIKVTSKRKLMISAGHCCEYQHPTSGIKCASKYQLQIDHIRPIALGGSNEKKNLRVLCRTHNLAEASRLGLKAFG